MTDTFNYKGLVVETDGTLGELAARATEDQCRGAFLKRAAIFGGGVAAVASGAMAFPATSRASKASDIEILNFALTLEYLESTFYAIGVNKAPLDDRGKVLAKVIRDHEITHVKALVSTIRSLGGNPVKKPKFNFNPEQLYSSQTAFLQTAMALEDTGVSAYNGAGPALTLMPVKKAAASIVAVEAMHASWVRGLAGTAPAPLAFDQALSVDEVLAIAKPFFG